ncbi:transcriptional regulator with XRE-family HTH domain [Bradyrhizobium sp. USDA 4341]
MRHLCDLASIRMLIYVFLCISMHMTSTERRALGKALENFRREQGLNQGELARQLGVTQSHISRVISGEVSAGNKLKLRIESILTAGRRPEAPGRWLAKVGAAAERSRDFKRLVDLAMAMFERRK